MKKSSRYSKKSYCTNWEQKNNCIFKNWALGFNRHYCIVPFRLNNILQKADIRFIFSILQPFAQSSKRTLCDFQSTAKTETFKRTNSIREGLHTEWAQLLARGNRNEGAQILLLLLEDVYPTRTKLWNVILHIQSILALQGISEMSLLQHNYSKGVSKSKLDCFRFSPVPFQ